MWEWKACHSRISADDFRQPKEMKKEIKKTDNKDLPCVKRRGIYENNVCYNNRITGFMKKSRLQFVIGINLAIIAR